MAELRKEFHQELRAIEARVVELFALVAEDLAEATEALLKSDPTVLKKLEERQLLVDHLYSDLELLVERELALQAPAAADLRLLLSVLRILPDLDRAHHLAVDIAEHATHVLSHDLSPRTRGLVQTMGDTAADMWNTAANAWYGRDRTAAEALEAQDDDLDSLHSSLMAELASGTMRVPVAMDMALVARFYERLGEHAVNVARRVVYLAGHELTD
jgi:phosphate transport system protein